TGSHRASIAHEHLNHAHEDMINGLPVNTRALHRHDGAVLGHQPITEGQQLRVDGAKLTQCRYALAVIANTAHTRRQGSLVYVETTTHGVNHLHRCVLLPPGTMPGEQTTGLRLQVGYSHA